MSEKETKNNKKNSKGFYVALGLCLVAVGAAAFITYGTQNMSSTNEINETTYSESQEEPTETVDNTLSGITEKNNSDVQSTTNSTTTSSSQLDSITTAKQTYTTVYPAGEDVINEFSGTDPVYSITLNDWRTHDGTDFAATEGSEVQSIANGKVIDIYTDDMYGKTIAIEHDNNFVAYYCGLSDEVSVEVGDEVSVSQTLGNVGTVPCECLEEPHLHLMITEDNQYIDPMQILGIEVS